MLTAELSCGRYRSALIVSVASLIPSLEPRLQFEQTHPGDGCADKKARHHEWRHHDLLAP
jgi:hypothetical protein